MAGYPIPQPTPDGTMGKQVDFSSLTPGYASYSTEGHTTVYDDQGRPHPATVDKNGNILTIDGHKPSVKTTPKKSITITNGTGNSGPTWYEQQQVALDKQRIKDAEAAQKAQLAYQQEQQKIAQSNAVESANQAFREAQLKSTYGTINGMAYGAPKGSPFVQMLPEPMLIKEAYAANKQPDPWNQPAPYGGYTGQSFMNAQQPGLSNQGDPNMQVPTSGPGSLIPIPTTSPSTTPPTTWAGLSGAHDSAGITSMAKGGEVPGYLGQPQLIMAHGGEEITPAPGTPLPSLLGSPGGAPFSNPLSSGLHPAIANLLSAVQGFTSHPDFRDYVPSFAVGGTVLPVSRSAYGAAPTPWAPLGMRDGASQSLPLATPMASLPPVTTTTPDPLINTGMALNTLPTSRDGANQSPPVATTGDRGGANQSPPPPTPIGDRGGANQSLPPNNKPPAPGPPLWYTPPVNAYGQITNDSTVHSPTYNDIKAGPGVLNHMPYSPVLTGLSGYGATMTPDGTPVVMSNWQRAHLMQSSISGPGGYDDYVMQVAGWSPDDMKGLGNSITGNFGSDLSAPKNYAPISIPPSPAGG